MEKKKSLKIILPTHPGEILREELESRMISQRTFAECLGIPYITLNEALLGNRPITCDIALLMEAAFGIDAAVLVNMQGRYNLALARTEPDLAKRMRTVRKTISTL